MSGPSNAISETYQAQRVETVRLPVMRTFLWSVRRELMEQRWIYLGQLALGGVILLGFFIGMFHLPAHMQKIAGSNPADRWQTIAMPYNVASGMLMVAMILMAIYYCADALYGERRDRSILFWKSLPVSDVTTVLAKASIPVVVLPLVTFAVTVVVQAIILLVSSVVLLGSGISPWPLWTELSVFRMWGLLLYHLFSAHALWPFPVYCWLILVSGWAKRAPILWGIFPIAAIGILDNLIFHTWDFAVAVGLRLIGGGAPTDITPGNSIPMGPMTHITPGEVLRAGSFWIGLLLGAIFLAVAARMRRYRTPV
jgi:ABC-2 type transport system permease protein